MSYACLWATLKRLRDQYRAAKKEDQAQILLEMQEVDSKLKEMEKGFSLLEFKINTYQ